MKKLITLRSAVVMGAALAAGSVTGSAAEALGGHVGVGPVITGAVTLWFAEKLDRLIADEDNEG
ncbi:hypothetical protein ABT052_32200 [Streptomyces sp. NPDC002766]|jgi:hypothetical protein|uniref:hypothetical protein n=1 Tax=unclassified Streptomyces TaxID=2593676 RepID=UPI00333088A8